MTLKTSGCCYFFILLILHLFAQPKSFNFQIKQSISDKQIVKLLDAQLILISVIWNIQKNLDLKVDLVT